MAAPSCMRSNASKLYEIWVSSCPATGVPPSRLASLARFAGTAKVTAISRLPPVRRLATLIAFIHCLEATAHDDVIEVLDMLLHEFFSNAIKADKKARLRGIKDLDQAATVLATACRTLLDPVLADSDVRNTVFADIPREELTEALLTRRGVGAAARQRVFP